MNYLKDNLIIFYGTLQKGMGRRLPSGEETPNVTNDCVFISNCLFTGTLYNNNKYPLYIEDGDDLIKGELWMIKNKKILEILDIWEDEYSRKIIDIKFPNLDKKPTKAMIYVYDGSVTSYNKIIPHSHNFKNIADNHVVYWS